MKIPEAWLRRAFVGASTLWALTLPLTSYAASRPAQANGWYAFAFAVYGVGGLLCHQRPERSFHLWSAQMPVCARCAGIYAGAALTSLLAALRSQVRLRPHAQSLLVASFIPTAASLIYEWTTGHTPSNTIRALAGAPLGAAVALVIVAACRGPLGRPVLDTRGRVGERG